MSQGLTWIAARRMPLVALVALLALTVGMFMALAPARAHDLGSCSNPEYLTASECRMNVAVDHDDQDSTDDQVSEDGTAPTNNDPWTADLHTAANHPPTLTIKINDSDDVVSANGGTVTITVTSSGMVAANPDANDDGTVSAGELETFLGDRVTRDAGTIVLAYVRVSGEIDHPVTANPGTVGEEGALSLEQTDPETDDDSVSMGTYEIIVPAGTTEGDYTVSAALATDVFDYNGKAVSGSTKSATATLTVGDAGTGLSFAELSLGNRVSDDKATETDETAPESGSDAADGDGINLVVTALNSLGNKSNDSDVTQATVIAQGGTVTLTGTLTANADDDAATRNTATGTNSVSLGGSGTDESAMVGQTTTLNVQKADGKPGTVDVYVILAGAGAGVSDVVTLAFTGDASSLVLGDASGTLHYQMKVSEPTTDPDTDTRDRISFALSATDSGGNDVAEIPSVTFTVTDPNGKRIASNKLERTQGADASAVPNAKITLDTTVGAPAGLPIGEYTITVARGTNEATQTFTVAGNAADIVATAESNTDTVQLGSLVTVTASVTDSDGVTVADGTVVNFTTAGALKLSDVGTVKGIKTKAGSASARFVVNDGSGLAAIIVTSGAASTTTSISSAAADAVVDEPDPEPVDGLSRTELNNFASWSGEGSVSASELLAGIAGASGVLFYDGDSWQRYGVTDGQVIPGSRDFTVRDGDVIWISG